jgi:hypothetical protein
MSAMEHFDPFPPPSRPDDMPVNSGYIVWLATTATDRTPRRRDRQRLLTIDRLCDGRRQRNDPLQTPGPRNRVEPDNVTGQINIYNCLMPIGETEIGMPTPRRGDRLHCPNGQPLPWLSCPEGTSGQRTESGGEPAPTKFQLVAERDPTV